MRPRKHATWQSRGRMSKRCRILFPTHDRDLPPRNARAFDGLERQIPVDFQEEDQGPLQVRVLYEDVATGLRARQALEQIAVGVEREADFEWELGGSIS